MTRKLTSPVLLIFLCNSIALASESGTFFDPDTTNFRYKYEQKGDNKFCDLVMTATFTPHDVEMSLYGHIVVLNAVAWRNGPGESSMVFSYEVKHYRSLLVDGVPSKPQQETIINADISSNIFSSADSTTRIGKGDALYVVDPSSIAKFVEIVTRGNYYLKTEIEKQIISTFVIRGDENLLKISQEWLKCSIDIAK